ncbi:hypothetical protein LCGC14_0231150 [marine sediment metagenome]|uniref:Phage portal protein n=1 Tax=marine sediment metagenome TaxID=412755 RepID=A0A0F9XE07_9ZZZZ
MGNVLRQMTQGVSSHLVKSRGWTPIRTGSRELMELYSSSPWLRAIVNKIGKAVAETDWRLYVAKNSNGQAIYDSQIQRASFKTRQEIIKEKVDLNQVVEIIDHPLLDLIHDGNDILSGNNVFQVTQHHMDLVGEGYWLIERDGMGVPISLWPLPPDWVKRLPTKKNPFYTINFVDSSHVEIPITEMITFRDPDPANPYGRGTGIARSLGDELEIDEYASKHAKAFFYNRARPDIIIYGDNINSDDAKRLEEKWLEKHQGFWNSFKPLFFSRKIEVKELTQSMEDLQMVPMRKFERDTFINVFGIPPEKLGVVSDSKRSTITAADFFWAKDIIRPRVELMREGIQRGLVPQFDTRLILDYITPVIQDEEMEQKVMNIAPFAFKIDDFRDRANVERLGGDVGNSLVIPLNSELRPVKEQDESPPTPEEESLQELLPNLERDVLADLEERLPLIGEEVIKKIESQKD